MNTVALSVPLCLAVLAGGAHAEPIIKKSRPGIERSIDPANYAHCLWVGPEHAAEHAGARGGAPAAVTTLQMNGPVTNRIDLVIVGDGYQSADLPTYITHAQRGVDDLFATPPYDVYQELFNVHRVDVISVDSGVDNDPTQGISRNTALNMGFWCGGTERALCVDTGQAIAYAQNAPDWDQIFAVANSTKYGGVGYPSQDVGTYSGGNGLAPQIAIHELGHALGNLADEYTYGGPETYTGGEPTAKNVSVFNAADMASMQVKWSQWLGVNNADFDGLVDTFEGGNYSVFGIFRPTDNSMMRSLGREFNLPSVEGMIIEMWKIVSPVDTHTPTNAPLTRNQTVSVTPAASFLTTRWTLDGAFVGSGTTLNLSSLSLPDGESTLRVSVSDQTALVRDEAARDAFMTEAFEWTVMSTPADLSGDGVVDGTDLAVLIASWGTPVADLNNDGTTNGSDLAILLASWS